jgi:hypothetical protein
MKLYLDMCALKRPYDDQSQDRIWLETMAVIRILQETGPSSWTIVNSAALEHENARNPKEIRRLRTAAVLRSLGKPYPVAGPVLALAHEIRKLGFGDMDALHLAFAKMHRVQYFITCDDGIIGLARKREVGVSVVGPITFIEECCK